MTCSTHRRDDKLVQNFSRKIRIKETNWETYCRRRSRRKNSIKILKLGCECVEWIRLAKDIVNWRAFVFSYLVVIVPLTYTTDIRIIARLFFPDDRLFPLILSMTAIL